MFCYTVSFPPRKGSGKSVNLSVLWKFFHPSAFFLILCYEIYYSVEKKKKKKIYRNFTFSSWICKSVRSTKINSELLEVWFPTKYGNCLFICPSQTRHSRTNLSKHVQNKLPKFAPKNCLFTTQESKSKYLYRGR